MRIFLAVLTIAVAVAAGCSGSGSGNEDATSGAAGPSQAGARLVGVWLGIGVLDEERLRRKLESIADEDIRRQVALRAGAFQSTLIGAHFKPDGSLELDVEISGINGDRHRETALGSWRVVQQTGDEVVVETIEKTADGSPGESSLIRYRFIEDDHHFATEAPTVADIADCNPLFLFERQDMSEPAQAQQPAAADRR